MKTLFERMNIRTVLDESETGYYGVGSNCKDVDAASEAVIDALHDAGIFSEDGIFKDVAHHLAYSHDDVRLMAKMLIDFDGVVDGLPATKAVWFSTDK